MGSFPNNFNIFIIDKKTKKPIKNVAVKVTIYATHKNNYHLFPQISDDKGFISFSKTWLSEEIEKELNLFIMDYACRLNDCLPKMELSVISHDDINKAVYGMKLYKDYFKYSLADIESFSNVDNKNYKPVSQIVHFSGEETVKVVIELEMIKQFNLF